VNLQICNNFFLKLYLRPAALILLSVCISLTFIQFPNATAQDQCPSQYAGILYTSWSGTSYLLDPQYGFMINIPSNWDSSIQSNGYTFIPCENPEVEFDLQVYNLPNGFTTEQIAEQFVNDYNQNIDGYQVISSGFIDGTVEYSVLASIDGADSPTIWHAFIPITNTILYVTTLTTSSPDLYEKYSGVARTIYDSLATVTPSQANDLIQLATSHNEFMSQGFANAVEIGNQGMQNTLEIWQQSLESDRKLAEDLEQYYKEKELGLRP
jgi:hypothetical protein